MPTRQCGGIIHASHDGLVHGCPTPILLLNLPLQLLHSTGHSGIAFRTQAHGAWVLQAAKDLHTEFGRLHLVFAVLVGHLDEMGT